MSVERIDADLCNGCRLCIDACPMDVFRLDTFVAERGEFSPCRMACPAHVDIRSYVYFLKEGMIEDAVDILREALPLPAVTGRVCPHPCESKCARGDVDEAVNINSLERFVADYWLREKANPVRRIYKAKTSVVGSGPMGLSCAYFLVRLGYPVTVFEAMPVLGGMLRSGIPEYRLPRSVLDAQINYIKDLGVEFKTSIALGKDITIDSLKRDFDAVCLATGSQLSQKLELEGANLDGVLLGLDFLRDVNLKREVNIEDSVVVIGGGNVAIDAALTALRLGAKDVQLACLESREQMPAYDEEITRAIDEGIILNASWGPRRILGRGKKVTGIELSRCISVFDAQGSFNPCLDEKENKILNANLVILAIGQLPDLSFIPRDIKTTRRDTLQVDPITMETTLSGVFTGGNLVAGTSSVVEAIADGRRAAESIDRYLKGRDLKEGREVNPRRVVKPPKEGIPLMPRHQTSLLPVNNTHNFNEIKMGFDQEAVLLESQRCMTCGSRAVIKYPDDCQLCLFCERDCPTKAIYVSPEKKELPMLSWQ